MATATSWLIWSANTCTSSHVISSANTCSSSHVHRHTHPQPPTPHTHTTTHTHTHTHTGNPPFSEFSNHIAALFHITASTDPPPIPEEVSGRVYFVFLYYQFVLVCCATGTFWVFFCFFWYYQFRTNCQVRCACMYVVLCAGKRPPSR